MTPNLKSGMLIRNQDNNLRLILGNTAVILGDSSRSGILLDDLSFDMSKEPSHNVTHVYSEPTTHLNAPMQWWIQNERFLTHTDTKLVWEYAPIFPAYRKHSFKDGYIVVKFTSPKSGVVIDAQDSNFGYTVGYTSDTWMPYDHPSWQEIPVDLEGISIDDIVESDEWKYLEAQLESIGFTITVHGNHNVPRKTVHP